MLHGVLKKFVLFLAKLFFYFYGFMWALGAPKARKVSEVLELFYIRFLRVQRNHVEVVKLDDYELVTRCRNPCPILWLSLRLSLDTKFTCRYISEPVCKYVLKRLNPNLVFERNYNGIRPYKDYCEERILLKS
ncbi:MAG: hypothetical protein N3F04_00725 [Candidatus Nezhaarchaeota archaeon]|nr:hypothetical protein [Candidatus Nezhaarchaeota archaeon]MCX8141300.1 hypothetical protein [Candidatus Nezhaarchaeota archaeon]MDW8049566.1 hypothetical protein [Nitrososphaerota archaeon]